MQGDKLFPRHQHVVGSSVGARPPHVRGGDGFLKPHQQLAMAARGQLGVEPLSIGLAVMGQEFEQRGLELLGVGVPELDLGQLLQMIVREPGMVGHR